jgi:hypothetical protein
VDFAAQRALIMESRKRVEAAKQANELHVANIKSKNPDLERDANVFYAAKSKWVEDVSAAVLGKTAIPRYLKKPVWLMQYELSKQEPDAEEYYTTEKKWMIDCITARKKHKPTPPRPTKSPNIEHWEAEQQRVETAKEAAHADNVRKATS